MRNIFVQTAHTRTPVSWFFTEYQNMSKTFGQACILILILNIRMSSFLISFQFFCLWNIFFSERSPILRQRILLLSLIITGPLLLRVNLYITYLSITYLYYQDGLPTWYTYLLKWFVKRGKYFERILSSYANWT